MKRFVQGFDSIYGRFFLLSFAILIPILMVQAEIYRDRYRTHLDAERRANLEVARGVAETFDQFVVSVLSQELAIGVALTSSTAISSHQIRTILGESQDEFAMIRNLGWISPQGRLLHVSDPFALGLDVSRRPYFQAILAGRDASVSHLFISSVTGRAAFTISRGIREDGKLLGVVSAAIEPEMLREIYPKERSQNRSFFLIDNEGRGVFHSSHAHWRWEDRGLSRVYPMLQDSLDGREQSGIQLTGPDGIERMVAFTPIPRIGWVAGVSIPTSEALVPIQTQLMKHAALFLLALAFALLAASLFALRTIGRPLEALQRFALDLGERRTSSRIPLVGPREFQDLGRTLNTMADEITRWTARSENAYRRLKTVLDTVPVGIVMARADTREISFVNQESRRILGGAVTGAEEAGRPGSSVFLKADGTPWARQELPLYRALKRGEVVSGIEILVRRADGGACMTSVNAAPIRDKDDRIWGALASLTDITERKRAEENLQRSEMQFREAFAYMPVGMVINDLEGRFLHVNAAYRRITGYTEEELLRSDFQSLTHPDDLGANLEEMQKLLVGEIPAFFLEKRYLRKGGETIWVRASVTLRRDVDGNPVQILGLVEDITDRKKTEEALRMSEEKFRSAFHANPSLMVISSLREGLLIEVNKAVEEVMGFTRKEMIGRTSLELSLWSDPEQRRQLMDRMQAEGGVRNVETVLRTRDGELRTLLFSGETISIEGLPCSMSAWVDITERKRMERELHQAYRKADRRAAELNAALDSLAEGVVYYDTDHHIIHLNPSAVRLLGFGPEDVQLPAAERVKLFRLQTKERRVPKKEELPGWRALDGEVVFGEEMIIYPKGDDRPHHFLTNAAPIRMAGGEVVGAIQTLTDISDRIRMESAIRASLSEKEVLLKEIHHRVKNNMQVVSSLISLQQNDLQSEVLRSVFQDLAHRVRSMALVHEKLYQSPDLARVAFADYADSLLGYLWRAHAAAPGVRLVRELEPVALSATSAVPCGLILNELVGNALKHAFAGRPGGEVRVSLRNSVDGKVRLIVRDNGKGLPVGFDWRQSRSLGLRLVQMLERQLQATVAVASGGGTAFTVTFEDKRI